MGKIIGIDLGTTNSAFVYMLAGKPEVISMPKVIAPRHLCVCSCGQWLERLVGQAAQRQACNNKIQNTIYGVKRLIGRVWRQGSTKKEDLISCRTRLCN